MEQKPSAAGLTKAVVLATDSARKAKYSCHTASPAHRFLAIPMVPGVGTRTPQKQPEATRASCVRHGWFSFRSLETFTISAHQVPDP